MYGLEEGLDFRMSGSMISMSESSKTGLKYYIYKLPMLILVLKINRKLIVLKTTLDELVHS